MITTRLGVSEAIREKRPQCALVTFPALPVVFTTEDIAVSGGICFEEMLNGDENLNMGRAVQSSISISLINDNGLLHGFDYSKEFDASIGVELLEDFAYGNTTVSGATLAVLAGSDESILRIEASESSTSIYANGTAYSVGGNPLSLVVIDGKLYVIGVGGVVLRVYTVNASSLSATSIPSFCDFMKDKFAKWADARKCVYYGNDGTVRECRVENGQIFFDLYQCIPLGRFICDRPDKTKSQIVNLSGVDLMRRFEKPAVGWFDQISDLYPMTLGHMFESLCEYCGIEVGDASSALNMDRQFDVAPLDNNVSTCRDVLAWIAEAACCYARMSRNGQCDLVWFSRVDYTLAKDDYFSIDVAEYEVEAISKVHARVTQDDAGVVVGDGENGYDIIDNPYLSGTLEEALPWVTNIYNRLTAFDKYSPVAVSCEGNWALCCGDIIVVETTEGNTQVPIFSQIINWSGNAKAEIQSTGERVRGVMTAQNREKLINGRQYLAIKKSVDGLEAVAVKQGEEFRSAAVSLTYNGIEMNTDKNGSISASVDGVTRLLIDENGVRAPLVTSEEVRIANGDKYTVLARGATSGDLWKGSIQESLDALPKYLTQDTTLTVPAGTYAEDVVIKGFMGSKLKVLLSAGVTINGTVNMSNCMDVELFSDYLGNAFIYPRTAGYTVIGIYNCQAALLRGLYISGYRGRTASVPGSTIGVEVYCSNARIYYDCIEYTSNYAYYQDRGTFYMENVIGGSEGSDAATNANLGYGVRAFNGAHGAIYGRCPLSVNGFGAALATLVTSSAAPTAGGMKYVAPTEFTKSFAISKHCTYVFGDKRIRDDQSTWISQGRYGEYEVASHNNYWRLGAMWFADAASALAGKTIKSAKLKIRRGTGGTSGAVDVYLYKVELTESNYSSTTKPVYPTGTTKIGTLAREAWGEFDVTNELMNAIKAGYALCVYQPRKSYSGSYSSEYATFYGKGTSYEPVLIVTYEEPTTEPVASAVAGKALVGQIKVGEV